MQLKQPASRLKDRQMFLRRGIVYEPECEALMESLARQFPRIHEVMDGLALTLAKEPREHGVYHPASGTWQARLINPPLLVSYEFTDRILMIIKILPDSSIN